MQTIKFQLFSLRRCRAGINLDAGTDISLAELPRILNHNQRLIDQVQSLADEISALQPAYPAPITLHIPLLNGHFARPSLDIATVERRGKAIWVQALQSPGLSIAYRLALGCLLRLEEGLPEKLGVWLDAPREKSAEYKPVYGPISRLIQQCLREKLTSAWFSQPNALDNTALSQAMLMYKASPVAVGLTRQTLCRDVLAPKSVNGVFHVTKWTLQPVLSEFHDQLRSRNHPRAHMYRVSLADEIHQKQCRLGSPLRTILLTEQEIINAFSNIGVELAALMAKPDLSIRRRRTGICRISEERVVGITNSLGRFLTVDKRGEIAEHLLDQATWALKAALERQKPRLPYAA